MNARRRVIVIAAAALLAVGALGLSALARDKKAKKAAKGNIVEVKTSMGSFRIELYPDKTPRTVENFLAYVDAKYYDGTIFHRVIADFMIQGGGFDKDLSKKTTRDPVMAVKRLMMMPSARVRANPWIGPLPKA